MVSPSMHLLLFALVLGQANDPSRRFVYPSQDGRLVYTTDARGNRIPDFSHSGYGGGGVAIPDVPVRVVVPPGKGNGTPRIQAAIDQVSSLQADPSGFRGAVLLLAGRHEVAGSLQISASGIVLRGQPGTTLVATGKSRRTLIEVRGKA